MKDPYSAPIPEVPRDWQAIPLGEVCSVENGCPFESRYFNEHEGLPLVRVRDVNAGVSKTLYSGPYESRYLVENGDLLVGMDGEFHVRKWTAGKALLNQRVCRLMPDANRLDKGFLAYAIRAPLSHIEAHTPYTTVKHISARQILAIPLPYPPLHEQRQIASALSAVQRAIERQERLIALNAELKKALMHKLFTEGTHGESIKKTEIGPLPETWMESRLGNVVRFSSGGTPSREVGEYWAGGTISWVKTGEIDYCTITKTEEQITQAGLNNSSAKIFPAGTLLMAMYGQGVTRGRVGILGIAASTNQACAAIMPYSEEELSTVFLYYFLEFHYENLRRRGHGANQTNLSMTLLKQFPVYYPKLHAQQNIVSVLRALDEKRAIHERGQAALTALFRSLLHQLMTAQIRVYDLDLSALEQAGHEPAGAL